MVTKRALWYRNKLTSVFGGVRVIEQSSYFVFEVTKDKPLLVNYRVWLQTGLMKGDEIAARSTAFVEPVEVKAK